MFTRIYKQGLDRFGMRKEIKAYGNTNVIVLDAEDMRVYDLKVGEFLDIEFIKVKEIKK